jgi:FtsP/CotA-like multicopper oxidase with cupredoxin domain
MTDSIKRREFLRTAVATSAALGTTRLVRADPPTRPSLAPTLEVNMAMRPAQVQMLAGASTNVWRFEPTLVKGRSESLSYDPDRFIGTIFRVRQGDRVRVNVLNQLPEPTVVHWHGLDVPADMDGHPRDIFGPGESFAYEFDVMNRAGTYWFHPHPDMRTAAQVMNGLAGMFIVSDCVEDGLSLPRGSYDLPVIIQDRSFTAQNQFQYPGLTNSGFIGNRILVNGQVDPAWSMATCVYRLRVLNGSNARTYKLMWSDGSAVVAIAADGGLLPNPVVRPYILLSPGERVDLWVDLRSKSIGEQIRLRSAAWTPGGPTGGGGLPQGAAFDILTLNITRAFDYPIELAAQLAPLTRYRLEDAVNATAPKQYPVSLQMGMFMLNGRAFEMNGVQANEISRLGDLELIEITNSSGVQIMPHPIHFHGPQFQILSRTIGAAGQANYATVRDGFIDEGWKDTFLLMPHETVRLLVKREKHTGLFLYHCHLLEHEDMGMMRNFRVDP